MHREVSSGAAASAVAPVDASATCTCGSLPALPEPGEVPADDDRYFYFPDVAQHDWLFRAVVRAILPNTEPTRSNKASLLAELRDRGVFLIDLKPDPVDGSPLSPYVPALLDRIVELAPERIILIKADVYDAAYPALAAAGLPVSKVRVPFPSSGRQREFAVAFGQALAGE
ncbi:hypothetical protein ABFV47_27205 [Mycolicibacterium fortuitum]|uniref:hypothetical protein n=1 Tax=Mycolicibacterium fortuitum TaxID=1766 RepID=UPI001F3DEEE1|nr:hypothetical protein [Mycolicibacterium fortuitum]